MNQSNAREKAKAEIKKSLFYYNFSASSVGISLLREPSSMYSFSNIFSWSKFVFYCILLHFLLIGETLYMCILVIETASMIDFIYKIYIIFYGLISYVKMIILFVKRNVFKKLLQELIEIWPSDDSDPEVLKIKQCSLKALRMAHFGYTFSNEVGVLLYFMPQTLMAIYSTIVGSTYNLGHVWNVAYPFDKNKPLYHEISFIFEVFSALGSVWFMLSSDLLVTAMISHITMLLKLLQLKIERLATDGHICRPNNDYTEDIIVCIKLHQRIIRYFYEIDDAFSVVNLINIILSSLNICCVTFIIVILDPLMESSNKVFLSAALLQMGIICWYADNLSKASSEISDAVYHSGWLNMNTRSRKLLLLIIQRSHKPLFFTAMKFSNITMKSFASILKSAYSYFTLLYTMYSQENKNNH